MSDPQKSAIAIIPMVTSLLTLAAALFPTKVTLGILSQHPDEVRKICELLGGVVSALWLYIAKPHPALRAPWDDLTYWIASHLRRRPTS